MARARYKKTKFYRQYAKGISIRRTTYKSKGAGLENNTFDVGAASNPAKFSKLLKNTENYIQKTYRNTNNMAKRLQQIKRVSVSYPTKPKKQDPTCCDEDGNPNLDVFVMAVFAWKKL